ncbi:MAG: SUMF1/EgtB/PvdO family nonheme iron enzyme [Prochloraceae cyanobacterium]
MWLGIDFGNCYSSAVLIINNKLEPIGDAKKNSYLFPSSIYIGEGESIFVGREADREAKKDPNRYCRGFKQNLQENPAYQLGNKKYHSEELIAYLLRKIKQEAEDYISRKGGRDRIDSAAIAIPANYKNKEKKLIEKAAKAAGFKEVALIEEAIAAAIYWNSCYELEPQDLILVYDLGGSSFQANLIEKKAGEIYKIIGETLELKKCAGEKFDRLIYQDLQYSSGENLKKFLELKTEDIQTARARLILINWCEEIKKQFKENAEVEELIPGFFSDFYNLTRAKFNKIIEPHLQKTIASCKKLIHENLKISQDIKGVLLIGGSCHIPYVKEILAKEWSLPIWLDPEPELAIARGMALYGASIADRQKAGSFLSQGIARLISKERQSAIDRCQRAIKIDPQLSKAYYIRGLIFSGEGATAEDLKIAIENFDRAIQLHPDWEMAFLSRGMAKMSLKDFTGAMADFDRAGLILDRDAADSELEKAILALPDFGSRQTEKFEFETITVNVQGEEIKRTRGNAKFFSENLGKDTAIEMIAIPGGTFIMGSSNVEGYNWEKPQHQVKVKPFFMSKFPITQKIWRAIALLPRINRDIPVDPAQFKGENLPVESIAWEDVKEFCDRLSKKTGLQYRLPSEAEWEYAARAGSTTPFYFGQTITSDLANYDGNYTHAAEPTGEARGKTTRVGTFLPNAFGLYDLHGNVWEWCADSWHDNYNSAPDDGSVWLGNSDRPHLPLLRGGCWSNSPDNCRSASRLLFSRDLKLDRCGFRVVCTVYKN